MTLLDLLAFLPGIVLQLNATIITGILIMLLVFAIQHTGILRAARTQTVIALLALVPLVLIAVVPILNGSINSTTTSGLWRSRAASTGSARKV